MIKVGITGGIGSGKTTICKMFELLDIPIYYADTRAKYLMSHDKGLKTAIKQLLGDDAYHRNGRLNRQKVASIVFNDKKKLAALNALVHPAVAIDGELWFSQQNSPYAVKEAALMIESKSHIHLDKLIVVVCDEEIRIKRVIERDNTSREQVESRIKSQLSDEARLEHADYTIDNSGTQSVIKQVISVHKSLLKQH